MCLIKGDYFANDVNFDTTFVVNSSSVISISLKVFGQTRPFNTKPPLGPRPPEPGNHNNILLYIEAY